ncbi:MAG: hypothetical protein H0V56_14530 [Chthoniobacterales bacterium]|nr:hypothetical protein [Chthoniobacterales bacterium]
MNEAESHLSEETCGRYGAGSLSAAELLSVSDHLARCADCRARLRTKIPTEQHLRGWEADLLVLDDTEESPAEAPVVSTPAERKITRFPRPIMLAAAAALAAGFAWLMINELLQPPATLVQDRQVAVRADGSVVAAAVLPEDLQQQLERVALARQVAVPDFTELRPRAGGALMAAPAGAQPLQLLAPVGEIVETPQPELRWTPVSGATIYRLVLTSLESQAEEEVELTTPSWTSPVPLAEGVLYEWKVYAIGDEVEIAKAPQAEARFRVLSAEARRELAIVRERFGDSPLLLGIATARAGLLREAEEHFSRLVAEQPESQFARDLLVNLRKTQPPPSTTNGAQ